MARQSFAETMSDTQIMVRALQQRGENLPVGITPEQMAKLDTLSQKAMQSNVEQEKLKAQLKEKTAEFNQYVDEAESLYAQMKKYIKLGVPSELWREFGIEDKK